MAIELQKEKMEINWFAIAMSLIFVFFALAVTYFLFFRPPPLIERFNQGVQADSVKQELRRIDLDLQPLRDNEVYQQLERVDVFTGPVRLRRNNPFMPIPASTPPAQ